MFSARDTFFSPFNGRAVDAGHIEKTLELAPILWIDYHHRPVPPGVTAPARPLAPRTSQSHLRPVASLPTPQPAVAAQCAGREKSGHGQHQSIRQRRRRQPQGRGLEDRQRTRRRRRRDGPAATGTAWSAGRRTNGRSRGRWRRVRVRCGGGRLVNFTMIGGSTGYCVTSLAVRDAENHQQMQGQRQCQATLQLSILMKRLLSMPVSFASVFSQRI